ncbi:hypothetical protein Tco_0060958 [Tanacetum coccineum]
MCRRQGYMIKDMERKSVTTNEFWKIHRKVDQVLHEIIPQLAEKAIDYLIESNLKPSIVETIIEYRDAFRSGVPALISKEFDAQAPQIIEELFKKYVQNNVIQVHPTTTTSTETTSSADLQQQLYLKMKSNLQDQANDPTLWDVLKQYDAPPEGEKRVNKHKASKSSKSARGSSSKQSAKDFTTYNIDNRVPTIFDCARMKATLNDMLSNQFRNAEEYAYHLEQATDFMENQINGNTKEKKYIPSLHKIHAERFPEADLKEKMSRWITEVVRITTDQPYGLDFTEQIIVMRENDNMDSFSEAEFKYLNKNDIEDLYYLFRNKKVNYRETKLMNSLIMFIRSRVIWERVHDF